MKIGDRFRFKSPLSHQIWGEGVVYEVLEGYGRNNETWVRGLFHDEEYDTSKTVYDEDGTLRYVESDNAITIGVGDVELVE